MAGVENNLFKKSVRHSAIYAVGTIMRRLTGLVMLPIYTQYLSPSDYGVLELLSMAIEVMGILVGLRISQALFRYYILADSGQEKKEIVSTVLVTVLAATAAGILLLNSGSEWLTQIIFGSTEYVFEFRLFAFTLMTNAIAATGLSYIRARQQPIIFVSIGIFTLFLQVVLNILFVVHYEMHVRGVVYSALISGGVVATGLSIYVFWNVGLHYSVAVLRRLLRFVSPLILASLGAFYVAYADKYFIRVFSGLEDVGLYALAGRVGSILGTVFEAFNMSWGADRFEVYKKDNAREIYDQVFRGVGAVLILVAAGLSLFAGDLFRVMTQPSFYLAGYIVPLLTFVALVNVAVIFCNFGMILREKTRHQAEASWIKAAVATIGFLALIPSFGAFGAAFTAVFSGLVQYWWLYKKSTALYDMNLDWGPVRKMLLLALLTVSAGLLLPQGSMTYFVARVAMFAALLWSFYALPLWKDSEREAMQALVRRFARSGAGSGSV